jgi:hypothetical protein
MNQKETIIKYARELEESNRMTPIVREAIDKAIALSSQYPIIIYIAGGLTGMSEEIKMRYGQVSDAIAEYDGMFGYAPHLHGTDPVAHPHVTPEEVRDIDYLFAAIVPKYHINCWYPVAHGNAVEAGWAEIKNIPSFHLVPEEMVLSRLVRGMTNIAATITYVDFSSDGLKKIQEFLTELE